MITSSITKDKQHSLTKGEHMYIIYSKDNCGPCELVKRALDNKKIKWVERNISLDNNYIEELNQLGYQSVPVVVRDNVVLFNGYRPDIINKL